MSIKNLLKALGAIKAELRPVQMTGHNDYDDYDYANETDILGAIDPLMKTHGVVLIKSTEDVESIGERATKRGGTEYAVRVKMVGTFYHVESGESISITSYGDGQDRGDKGIYKAMTGASKYLMSKAFGLATGDDPERDSQQNDGMGQNQHGGNGGGGGKGKPPKSQQGAGQGTQGGNKQDASNVEAAARATIAAHEIDEYQVVEYMKFKSKGAVQTFYDFGPATWKWATDNASLNEAFEWCVANDVIDVNSTIPF